MSLQSIFTWVGTTRVSQYLQDSTLWFPITEVFHLVGLTILLGAVFVVCLRLFGFGLDQPVSVTQRGLWGWTWFGLILVFGSGTILAVTEPAKVAVNGAFYYKLWFLGGGLAMHLFGYLLLLKPGRAEAFPLLSKFVAVVTLVMWFGAGVAGRAIGFV